MLGVSVHFSDVQEIKTRVTEITQDLLRGWITLEGEGGNISIFFRDNEDVERMIEALRALKRQFTFAEVGGEKE
jgi:hypothetical protein